MSNLKAKLIVKTDKIIWYIILYTYGKLTTGMKAYNFYTKYTHKHKWLLHRAYYQIGEVKESINIIVNY